MSQKRAEAKYSKAQILESQRFMPQQKDFLQALLQDGASYTLAEAEEMLDQFLAREVE